MRRRFFFLLLFIILLQFGIKTFSLRADDNIQNISIKKGWNFIAWCCNDTPPGAVEGITDIVTIWRWNENNNWELWSGNTYIVNLLNSWKIPVLKSLHPREGYWIYSEKDTVLNIDCTVENPNYYVTKEWNLLGWCDNDTYPVNVYFPCCSGTIWKWDEYKWKLYSFNENMANYITQYKIPVINKIKKGEAFWYNVSNFENDNESENNSDIPKYDIDKYGIPQFVNFNYIELDKIGKISKFRSGIGHDYSDDFENCRSMKHYFIPKQDVDWSTIKIFSPISGKIVKVYNEWAGTQLQISSNEYPAFIFIIFHINLAKTFNKGDEVAAGEFLGTHIGGQTTSDIAVGVNTPSGWKLISFFQVMKESLFDEYKKRGVNSIDNLIITKEERDAEPLTCKDDESFENPGTLENYVILK